MDGLRKGQWVGVQLSATIADSLKLIGLNAKQPSDPLKAEVARLKRELARVTQERDILKKAERARPLSVAARSASQPQGERQYAHPMDNALFANSGSMAMASS